MATYAAREWIGVVGTLAVLGLAGTQAGAQAQSKLRQPAAPVQAIAEPTVEDELYTMSQAAAVIFAGQVVSVQHKGGTPEAQSSGWVEIEFQVEEAIRGCVAQGTYTLREWAGLWTSGTERYRVGQTLLMMLHAPGTTGLSSPVGGQDGALPVTGSGLAPGPHDTFTLPGDKAVDLRWIESRLVRAGSAAEGSVARLRARALVQEQVLVGRERAPLVTRKSLVGVRNNLRLNTMSSQQANVFPTAPALPDHSATLGSVLAMLGSWEAQQSNGTR